MIESRKGRISNITLPYTLTDQSYLFRILAMTRGPNKQFDTTAALESAMRVFWAKGYAAAGLTELLEAMDIGRKSMYDTFGNKRRLFLQCLQHYSDTVVRGITEVLGSDDSPLENVRRSLEYIDQQNGKRVSNGCLLGVSMAQFRSDDCQVADLLCEHLKVLEDAYYEQFRRARELGELAEQQSPRDLARVFTATVQGLTLIRRVNEAPAMSRGIVKGAHSLLDALQTA